MAQVVFWMMGGLSGASWGYVAMIAPMFAAGIVVPLLLTRQLNLMLLGDERALPELDKCEQADSLKLRKQFPSIEQKFREGVMAPSPADFSEITELLEIKHAASP